jgi:NH3-dependent NAD+ synthetase
MKSDVRALAEYLKVPQSILDKLRQPTDMFGDDRSDEDTIGRII